MKRGTKFTEFTDRLGRNQDGSTVIEFGLGLPMLMMMLIGTIEVGYIMFSSAVLEGSLREVSRTVSTGFVEQGLSREDYILQQLDDKMLNLANVGNRTISITFYDTFANVGEPEPIVTGNGDTVLDPGECYLDINGNAQWDADMASTGLGGPGAVQVFEVTYEHPLMTGFFSKAIGGNGTIELTASTAIKNDSFNAVSGGGATVQECAPTP